MKETFLKVGGFLVFALRARFTLPSNSPYQDEKARVWKTAFAFLPVYILVSGMKTKIWMKFYQTRLYQEVHEDDELVAWVIRENRALGSPETHKETLYGISC